MHSTNTQTHDVRVTKGIHTPVNVKAGDILSLLYLLLTHG